MQFKILRLRDCRWAEVDENWRVYSMGLGTKLLGSGILNFGPCAARGHPEHSPVGRDEAPSWVTTENWPVKQQTQLWLTECSGARVEQTLIV